MFSIIYVPHQLSCLKIGASIYLPRTICDQKSYRYLNSSTAEIEHSHFKNSVQVPGNKSSFSLFLFQLFPAKSSRFPIIFLLISAQNKIVVTSSYRLRATKRVLKKIWLVSREINLFSHLTPLPTSDRYSINQLRAFGFDSETRERNAETTLFNLLMDNSSKKMRLSVSLLFSTPSSSSKLFFKLVINLFLYKITFFFECLHSCCLHFFFGSNGYF